MEIRAPSPCVKSWKPSPLVRIRGVERRSLAGEEFAHSAKAVISSKLWWPGVTDHSASRRTSPGASFMQRWSTWPTSAYLRAENWVHERNVEAGGASASKPGPAFVRW